MTCVVPSNQSIYEALIKEAALYTTYNPNRAKAYNKASDSILSSKINIYKIAKNCNNLWNWLEDFEDDFPDIGSKISTFIFEYVEDNSEPTITLQNKTGNESIDNARRIAAMNDPMNAPKAPPPTPVPEVNFVPEVNPVPEVNLVPAVNQTINNTSTNETTNIVNDVMISLVRRSLRLQAKPKVQYNESDDDSDVVDDETYIGEEGVDEEDIDEREKIIQTIKDICNKKGWKYSDDLITEYDDWRATATEDYKIKRYSHPTGYTTILSEPAIAKRWATDYSHSLRKQKVRTILINSITKQCAKLGIQYEDTMYNKYLQWFRNPDNKKHFTRTIWLQTGKSYTYDLLYTYASCINKWLATLKKTIVW